MKLIEQLRDQIRQDHPRALVELTPPLHRGGVWSLDIDLAERKLSIEWSKETGFGVSSISSDNFGERPDEAFESVSQVRGRINELLKSGKRTVPPYSISLGRLRERCGITQQELARRLGVRQASVSGMERRDDIQLSTLRRILEALGGTLNIFGLFPDARYQIELLASDADKLSERSKADFPVASEPRCSTLVYEAAFPRLFATNQLEKAAAKAQIIKTNCAVIEMPA
jgi:transcriptional regulator with XRE-family HTH domain